MATRARPWVPALLAGGAVFVAATTLANRCWDAWENRRRRRCERRGACEWRRCAAAIVAFGDSITEEGVLQGGWTAALQEAFSRRADLLSRGFSGYTTRIFRNIVSDVLATIPVARREDVVAATLMFGANDAARPGDFQHVPEAEFLDNMKVILRRLRSGLPNAELIVLSPPHIDAATWEATSKQNGWGDGGGRSVARATHYGELAQQAAQECSCHFVDVRAAMVKAANGSASDLDAMLSDGLHLSPSGNKVVYDAVLNALKTRGVTPHSMPMFFPGMPTVFEVGL